MINNTYLNMEVAFLQDYDDPEFAQVTKWLRDANSIPIGTINDNPILDTCIYKVEYLDGHKSLFVANTIAENIFAQIDDKGRHFVLLDSIMDHRSDGTQVLEEDGYVELPNGGPSWKITTKGWDILIQWKDEITTWEAKMSITCLRNSFSLFSLTIA